MADTADSAESTVAKANTVYDSLVALLNTAPSHQRPRQRWHDLVPSIAIQIFRYTNAPQDFLPRFESKLAQHLDEMNSDLYQTVEQHFHTKVMMELERRVKDFRNLSGVALFSVATGGRVGVPGSGRWEDGAGCNVGMGQECRDEGAVEDMAVRLAHLGVLHWRVWAQMVYLDGMDEMAVD